ncbi:hypothetical protein [Pseudonocardia sp. ICBG601]|uniref:hypothetical protein n=1 Tax=Pseudonocardia sp. ICBG601 TaxID=2846759 RepID=UPI001CF6FD14|nr:hypothetical protein [Pseudonocardia sp. ICBG601]
MSGQVEDVPLLGLGREQTQAWGQASLAVASALRARRAELNQRAWSLERAASRASDQYARDLDPRVRAMAAADEAAFRAAAEVAAPDFEYLACQESQFGWHVETTIGPMPENSPSGTRGAWGLHARGWGKEKTLSVFVVVGDRETAVQLRDEITRGEQRTLKDLGKLGTYGHYRAEHARTEVREAPEQLRVRMAHSLAGAWPNDPELVAAVLRPIQRGGAVSYDEVDRLAMTLRELEDHGCEMEAVGQAVLIDDLREAYAGDPDAGLAGRLLGQVAALRDRIRGVDAEVREEEADTQLLLGPAAAVVGVTAPGHEQPRTAGSAGGLVRRTGADLGPAERLLRRHLAPATAAAMIGCRTWPGLAKQVLEWQAAGVDFEGYLGHLPEARVQEAVVPAAYAKAIIRSWVDQEESARMQSAAASVMGDVPEEHDRGEQRQTLNDGAAKPVTGPDRDGVPEVPFVIRELDPTNAVEREQLEMARGAGTVADDRYIDAILTSDDPVRTWLDLRGTPQSTSSAAPQEQVQTGFAVLAPAVAAAAEQVEGQAARPGLEHVVAQAERDGSPIAGALRAELAHHPSVSSTPRTVPETTQTPAPGPGPSRTVSHTVRRPR